jgi:alanine dehydrogenase
MPGAVPRTSTIALTNVTFTYVMTIAQLGWQSAVAGDPALRRGLNLLDGKIACEAVADSFGLPCISPDL